MCKKFIKFLLINDIKCVTICMSNERGGVYKMKNNKKFYRSRNISKNSLIEKQIVKNTIRSVKEGQSFDYKETNDLLTKVAYKPSSLKV